MPRSDKELLFISYAHKDGAELAQRLQKDLTNHGYDAWLDKQRIQGGTNWTKWIETALDKANYVLALLTSGSYVSEICRAEQLRALRKGKFVIPLLAQSGSDIPLYLEVKNYRDFSDPGRYDDGFQQLLGDIRGGVTATLPEAYRRTRVNYLTQPPRVANYLERPEVLRALRDTVFEEDRRQPISITALHGMGGIGKTVLAQALTHDEVVQQAFPDGIAWVTAGKDRQRDFVAEMREVAKALGDDLIRYENSEACKNQYRTTIADKAALIVVDDVWSKSDIEPLLAESRRSRFLFTTRDASIGRFVGAREHTAELMDFAQARDLLSFWANLTPSELPAEADALISECGRLPLAVSVVGAMLRGAGRESWKDTLDALNKADVSAIQEMLPDGQQSFFKAIEVSFKALAPQMQERYQVLAVLPEDMAVPLSILQALWNVNEAEARRCSRLLVDRSMAQREDAHEGIRLHDLQLDYVRAQYPDREALPLLRGAVRLSSNAITRDPGQFTSQMVGRLMPLRDVPAIARFADKIVEGTRAPWLRPTQPTLDPPGTALVRTLEGHTNFILGVAMSRDGRLAVSASKDRTLKVWEVDTGRELRTLEGHTGDVLGAAISRDGQLAISASRDSTLKVWEVASGRELRTLRGHSNAVSDVALSADGRLAVSASWDDTLKVWDVPSGGELRTLQGHASTVSGVALSGDGRLAVSASWDNTLKVWEVASGRELRTLQGHSGEVSAVAMSEDGRLAVSAGDRTLKVWEVGSGRELRTLPGRAVNGVALSRDGRVAVSASSDKTLKVWEVASGRELRTLQGHTGEVFGVAISEDGRLAISASRDLKLKVWELASERELRPLQGHSDFVQGVAMSGDGRVAVSASWDQLLKVWGVASGRELRTLRGHSHSVNGVALSGDGRLAVSASVDRTLKVWEVGSGLELRTLPGHSRTVNGVALSGDGRLAVSASSDQTLKVWEVASGRELRTLEGHSNSVEGVALSEDGRLAVSASWDNTLKVWEVASGRELRALQGHANAVSGVALSGDGRLAVSASWDRTLKVWEVASGRELRTLEGHSNSVEGVAMSRDGRLAVSASSDQTLKVWEVESAAFLATFTCDSALLHCAAAGDCQLIVAGDAGGRVHFVQIEEAKQ